MYLIGLFKIGCHLCQKLVRGYPYIHGKSQFPVNSVFDLTCRCDRIRINLHGSGHVQKHLINGKRLHHRRIRRTDAFKSLRATIVQGEIRRYTHQIRALLQGKSHRFPCLNPIFFCRDGFRHYNPCSLLRVTADAGRNLPQIWQTLFYSFSCFPGKESTIHIHMKNQPLHFFIPCLCCNARPINLSA